MCEGEESPLCVQWCLNDVLTYQEREEEVEESPVMGDLEMGLEPLVDRYGLEKLTSSLIRLSQKD